MSTEKLNAIIEPQDSEITMNTEETNNLLNAVIEIPQVSSSNPLSCYFSCIHKYKLLTAKEEVELSTAMKNGDETARETLICSNIKLVIGIAKSRVGLGLDFDDLLQEGLLGLMIAVNKFDPDKGFRFSTYACWWIKQSIQKAIEDNGRTIKIPESLLDKMYIVKKAITSLWQKLGKEATQDEIAEYLNDEYTEEEIEETLSLIKNSSLISMDSTIGDKEKATFGDTIGRDDNDIKGKIDAEDKRKTIQDILGDFKPIERRVITIKYGLETGEKCTLDETAKILGEEGFKSRDGKSNLTRERVRQIEESVLNKIRSSKQKMELLKSLL